MVEAMKRAYADRALFLGDPERSRFRWRGSSPRAMPRTGAPPSIPTHATPASDIHAGGNVEPEGHNTTHFSVVDRFGNAVSNTYTLNFSYGVGLVADGTGILLNNELDDFAAKPEAPNAYGLIGFAANAPGPGKRPLSSMTPTIVLEGRQAVPGHRLAGRQPHHHCGAANDRQRDRPRHGSSPARWRRRACTINGCPIRSTPSRRCRPTRRRVAGARRQGGAAAAVHLGQFDLITPEGFVGAADPRTRGALAAGY